MARAIDLFHQGRHEELWQKCCGYLGLTLPGFMAIQERLMMEQLELLKDSTIGKRLLKGARPRNINEFREQVPLTTFADYCPDFIEKKEDILPAKPGYWVRTSGRTGNYECKWVPMVPRYAEELSVILYGVGMLSGARGWGDTSQIPDVVKILYSVAPRPYISGTFADLLREQTPMAYLPSLEEAEKLTYDERIKLGFSQAVSEGLDYFFGLSLVLVAVGEKLADSTGKFDIRPFLKSPKALWRLSRAKIMSRLAGRPMLPKDIWRLRGIIGSGVDSWVYKNKIKELWGRHPLDLYSCTEGGVIATQTWDYEGMTFVPSLNFLEFIPEEEHFRWQMDHSYQPKTVLLDEVEAGENYEIVISNFHGASLVRYRLGDMIRITSLRNEKLGIDIPQMAFERRADDLISFMVVKLTEKQIWQSIEATGIPYEDWVAYKEPGEEVLNLLVELKDGYQGSLEELNRAIEAELIASGRSSYKESGIVEDWRDDLGFRLEVTPLPRGAFAGYIARKQAEGADPAHLKPPHINPSEGVLTQLMTGRSDTEEIIVIKRAGAPAGEAAEAAAEDEEITV